MDFEFRKDLCDREEVEDEEEEEEEESLIPAIPAIILAASKAACFISSGVTFLSEAEAGSEVDTDDKEEGGGGEVKTIPA